MILFYVALIALAAGMVQALAGFGCGIVMMLVLPSLFGILRASGISTAASIAVSAQLAVHYRKHAQLRIILAFAAAYISMSVLMIFCARYFDTYWLTVAFGAYLVLIACYNLLAKKKLRLKGSLTSALICGAVGGACSGLFAIGGPMTALYFLAATDDRESYMGNSQLAMSTSATIETLARVANGVLTADLLPVVIGAFIGIVAGGKLGDRFTQRIDRATTEKLVYIMVAISGAKTLLGCLR